MRAKLGVSPSAKDPDCPRPVACWATMRDYTGFCDPWEASTEPGRWPGARLPRRARRTGSMRGRGLRSALREEAA